MNNNSVPQNKSAPTATLLIYKKLIFEISAVFYICVSSFNFGPFWQAKKLVQRYVACHCDFCAAAAVFLAAVVG